MQAVSVVGKVCMGNSPAFGYCITAELYVSTQQQTRVKELEQENQKLKLKLGEVGVRLYSKAYRFLMLRNNVLCILPS